ncbi:hypothetical protein R6Z07F_005079 [Ovis aries]
MFPARESGGGGERSRQEEADGGEPGSERELRRRCGPRGSVSCRFRCGGCLGLLDPTGPSRPGASFSRRPTSRLYSGPRPHSYKGQPVQLPAGCVAEPLIHEWWEPPAAQSEQWQKDGKEGRGHRSR